MHIRYGIHSVCAQTPIRSPRPQTARLALWESSAAGGERESRLPLKRGNGQLFSLPKRKKVAKKKLATLQVDRCAPINCVAMAFSVPEGTLPQMAVLPTPKAKRLESVGSRNGGFDLMGAVRIRLHHANLTVRGNRVRMDAGVRRRGFIAPTWGFFPTVRVYKLRFNLSVRTQNWQASLGRAVDFAKRKTEGARRA